MRPEYSPKDPAHRLNYQVPGAARRVVSANKDLAPPGQVGAPAGAGGGDVVLPVHHRHVLPPRTTPDLLAALWPVLQQQLGAVPQTAGL